MPTLIVVGEFDIPDVHSEAGAIQAGVAGARRVVMPRAGHRMQMEKHGAFHILVLEFLATQR